MLRWSLIFIFAFLIVSIQSSENALPLNFFVATNSFEYMEIGPDGKEVPTNRDDKILMVGTEGNKIVGSAQCSCRHINPPAEQIILILDNALKFYPLNDSIIDDNTPISAPEKYERAAPEYGCLTLVHNYCSVPVDFKALGLSAKNAVLSKSLAKPAVGTKLLSAYLDENSNLQFGAVAVKDFKECEKHFDPENLYLVDKDEQICTDRVYRRKIGENRPIDFSSGLLFQNVKDKYYLVGIESKTDGGLSLSTFAPYHCNGFETTCSN